ncbi:hypothetical protein HN873_067359, partial [Arachis hypogaea]
MKNQKSPKYNLPSKILCCVIDAKMESSKNMTMKNPTQELVAKDIHGVQWKFKHIYR